MNWNTISIVKKDALNGISVSLETSEELNF